MADPDPDSEKKADPDPGKKTVSETLVYILKKLGSVPECLSGGAGLILITSRM